ncbi:hypothetical protein PAPYR_5129 [Paratrimastix pyriformis]|uniref:Uncharacterized protein n=1 Tax=Paratrimastix pyriformis TaxID=342808 RepID=A0ABQ8UIL5_9EUKA|nr:hypothetical protein PAPYR_5129 [Paratrimastix pyriformis]
MPRGSSDPFTERAETEGDPIKKIDRHKVTQILGWLRWVPTLFGLAPYVRPFLYRTNQWLAIFRVLTFLISLGLLYFHIISYIIWEIWPNGGVTLTNFSWLLSHCIFLVAHHWFCTQWATAVLENILTAVPSNLMGWLKRRVRLIVACAALCFLALLGALLVDRIYAPVFFTQPVVLSVFRLLGCAVESSSLVLALGYVFLMCAVLRCFLVEYAAQFAPRALEMSLVRVCQVLRVPTKGAAHAWSLAPIGYKGDPNDLPDSPSSPTGSAAHEFIMPSRVASPHPVPSGLVSPTGAASAAYRGVGYRALSVSGLPQLAVGVAAGPSGSSLAAPSASVAALAPLTTSSANTTPASTARAAITPPRGVRATSDHALTPAPAPAPIRPNVSPPPPRRDRDGWPLQLSLAATPSVEPPLHVAAPPRGAGAHRGSVGGVPSPTSSTATSATNTWAPQPADPTEGGPSMQQQPARASALKGALPVGGGDGADPERDESVGAAESEDESSQSVHIPGATAAPLGTLGPVPVPAPASAPGPEGRLAGPSPHGSPPPPGALRLPNGTPYAQSQSQPVLSPHQQHPRQHPHPPEVPLRLDVASSRATSDAGALGAGSARLLGESDSALHLRAAAAGHSPSTDALIPGAAGAKWTTPRTPGGMGRSSSVRSILHSPSGGVLVLAGAADPPPLRSSPGPQPARGEGSPVGTSIPEALGAGGSHTASSARLAGAGAGAAMMRHSSSLGSLSARPAASAGPHHIVTVGADGAPPVGDRPASPTLSVLAASGGGMSGGGPVAVFAGSADPEPPRPGRQASFGARPGPQAAGPDSPPIGPEAQPSMAPPSGYSPHMPRLRGAASSPSRSALPALAAEGAPVPSGLVHPTPRASTRLLAPALGAATSGQPANLARARPPELTQTNASMSRTALVSPRGPLPSPTGAGGLSMARTNSTGSLVVGPPEPTGHTLATALRKLQAIQLLIDRACGPALAWLVAGYAAIFGLDTLVITMRLLGAPAGSPFPVGLYLTYLAQFLGLAALVVPLAALTRHCDNLRQAVHRQYAASFQCMGDTEAQHRSFVLYLQSVRLGVAIGSQPLTFRALAFAGGAFLLTAAAALQRALI